jgi:Zn-dependent oligopeptidase
MPAVPTSAANTGDTLRGIRQNETTQPTAFKKMTATPTTSPLLELSGLPRFDAIQPAHVEPAVRSLLEALRSTVERLQDDPATPTWATFVEPIENEGERLGRAWGIARPYAQRHGHPRMARGLQRDAAGGHPFLRRIGAKP